MKALADVLLEVTLQCLNHHPMNEYFPPFSTGDSVEIADGLVYLPVLISYCADQDLE